MTPAPQSILIAGCGYLGTELARILVEIGWEVAALTRTTEGAADVTARLGIPALAADLGDSESLVAARRNLPSVEYIVHAASSSGGGPEAYHRVFIGGVANLARVFKPRRLVLTSSTSVYAQTDGATVDESAPAIGGSETSRLLRLAEDLLLAEGGVVARLAGLYGPGRSVILRKFLEGTAVLEEGGGRILNQIHRDDAARALLHLLNHPDAEGQIYNVADNTPLTQKATYTGLARHFGLPVPPEGPRPQQRKRGWTSKRVANAKLRAIGWHPDFPSFLAAVATDDRLLAAHRATS